MRTVVRDLLRQSVRARPSASVTKSCTPSVTSGSSAPSATAILLVALRITSRTTSTACSSVRCSRTRVTTSSGTADGVQMIASVRARAALVAAGQVALLVVVDGVERRLVGARRDRRHRAPGLAQPAVVLTGAAQPHQLGGRRVEGGVPRDGPHELVDHAPEVADRDPAGRGPLRGPEQLVEDGVEPRRDVADPDHLDDGDLVLARRLGERLRAARRPLPRRRCGTAPRRPGPPAPRAARHGPRTGGPTTTNPNVEAASGA